MKHLFIIAITSVLLTSCIAGGDNSSPTAKLYAFQSNLPEKTHSQDKLKTSLNIAPASINIEFAGRSFVYRTGAYEYINDPYHQFIASPNALITNMIEKQLAEQSTLTVVGASSLVNPNYILQLKIIELYADYQDKAKPKAVTTINATLLQVKNGETIQIATHSFKESRAISPNNPEDLMRAYDENIQAVGTNLVKFVQVTS
jgi:ABC-type uncharacterized transport system auxiliary subunit